MKKILCILFAVCMLMNISVFNVVASENQITVQPVDTDGNMKIDITAPTNVNGRELIIYVFNPGKSFADLEDGNVLSTSSALQFVYQGRYQDGLSVEFKMNTTKVDTTIEQIYTVCTRGLGISYNDSTTFTYYVQTERLGIIDRIKNEEPSEELADDAVSYYTLQYVDVYSKLSNKAEVVSILKAWNNSNELTDSNFIEMFKKAVLVAAAKQGKITADILIDYNDIIGFSNDFLAEFNNLSETGKNYLTNAAKNVSSEDFSLFVSDMKENVISSLIFGNVIVGYGNVDNVIKKYQAEFVAGGLNLAHYNQLNKEESARSMLGKGFMNFNQVITFFNTYVISSSGTQSQPSGGSREENTSPAFGNIIYSGNATTNKSFSDLDSVEWARDSIERLYNAGIVSGKETGIFAPLDDVTREEFVKMVVAAFNIRSDKRVEEFSDVKASDWSYDYILRAASADIVAGYGNEFKPKDSITRQDMAVISVRILRYLNKVSLLTDPVIPFYDANDISEYAKESVNVAYQMGIVKGVGNNNFMPRKTLTRAEAAVVVNNLLNVTTYGVTSNKDTSNKTEEHLSSTNIMSDELERIQCLGMADPVLATDEKRAVSRGEFAQLLIRFLKLENQIVSENENVFYDVAPTHQYAEYINYMASLGYADEIDYYRPDEQIKTDEAAYMLVKAMGYGEMLKAGDIPSSVQSLMATIQKKTSYSNATIQDIIYIFDNALEEDMLYIDTLTTSSPILKPGNFLNNYFNIYVRKGRVNATEISSVSNTFGAADGYVCVGEYEYAVSETLVDLNDLLGYQLKVYYTDVDGEEMLLYYEVDDTEMIIIEADRIIEYRNNQIFYNDNERRRSVEIKPTASIIYNGVRISSYAADIFDFESGYVELIGENKNYDIVKIYEFNDLVAASVSDGVIYSKYSQGSYDVDDYDKVIIKNSFGRNLSIEDIKEDNVISVAQSQDGTVLTVIVSDTIVNGTINSRKNEDGVELWEIDNEEYIVSSLCPNNFSLGEKLMLYLNTNNMIVYATKLADSKAWNLGYLSNAYIDDMGIMLKVFTQSGEMEYISSANKLVIDGVKVADEEAIKALSYTSPTSRNPATEVQPQLIKYTLDESNKVKRIVTARNVSGKGAELSLDINNSTRAYYASNGRLMTNTTNLNDFATECLITGNTIVFVVPGNIDEAKHENTMYEFHNSGYFVHQKDYVVNAYNVNYDNGGETEVIVHTLAEKYPVLNEHEKNGNANMMLVTNIGETVDEDENIVKQVKGYNIHTGERGVIHGIPTRDVFENVEEGDIIRYGYSGSNITGVSIDYDADSTELGTVVRPEAGWNTVYGSLFAQYVVMPGVVTDVKGKYLCFASKPVYTNGVLEKGKMIYDLSQTKCLIFDDETGTLEKINYGELYKYTYENDNNYRAVAYTSFGNLNTIVLYV